MSVVWKYHMQVNKFLSDETLIKSCSNCRKMHNLPNNVV
jgi:hypothetical protein